MFKVALSSAVVFCYGFMSYSFEKAMRARLSTTYFPSQIFD